MDGGDICAAASVNVNVALGTHLLISSQAVAVPVQETLALGADDWMGFNADGTGSPGADRPGFTSTSPALRRSIRRCRAVWAASVVVKGGCAPPIAQAGCDGPDSRICVRRLHLLAGIRVKVPDRCLLRQSDNIYVYIYIIQQFSSIYVVFESTLLNYANPCQNWTLQRFARQHQRNDATEKWKIWHSLGLEPRSTAILAPMVCPLIYGCQCPEPEF